MLEAFLSNTPCTVNNFLFLFLKTQYNLLLWEIAQIRPKMLDTNLWRWHLIACQSSCIVIISQLAGESRQVTRNSSCILSMYPRDIYALQNHFLPQISYSYGQGRAKQKKETDNINIINIIESYLKDLLWENSLRRQLHNNRINGKFGEGIAYPRNRLAKG